MINNYLDLNGMNPIFPHDYMNPYQSNCNYPTSIYTNPKLNKVFNYKFVEKGWGNEKILFNNSELCGKILTFNKGAKFSAHFHKNKYEFFYLLKGKISVEGINVKDASKYQILLEEGDTLEVPPGAIHQITALEESQIIEFSTHHEDSDSYRISPGDSQNK